MQQKQPWPQEQQRQTIKSTNRKLQIVWTVQGVQRWSSYKQNSCNALKNQPTTSRGHTCPLRRPPPTTRPPLRPSAPPQRVLPPGEFIRSTVASNKGSQLVPPSVQFRLSEPANVHRTWASTGLTVQTSWLFLAIKKYIQIICRLIRIHLRNISKFHWYLVK